MTVASILADKGNKVITHGSDSSVLTVLDTLAVHKIGAIMITKGNMEIEGIVSERDIVRAIARDGVEIVNNSVSTIMTGNVITCSESDTINSVMEKMSAGRFRHLPVAKDGKLVGLISIGDVVKRKIEQIEQEAEAMREYITQ
jgi:CBS domain-containing protein